MVYQKDRLNLCLVLYCLFVKTLITSRSILRSWRGFGDHPSLQDSSFNIWRKFWGFSFYINPFGSFIIDYHLQINISIIVDWPNRLRGNMITIKTLLDLIWFLDHFDCLAFWGLFDQRSCASPHHDSQIPVLSLMHTKGQKYSKFDWDNMKEDRCTWSWDPYSTSEHNNLPKNVLRATKKMKWTKHAKPGQSLATHRRFLKCGFQFSDWGNVPESATPWRSTSSWCQVREKKRILIFLEKLKNNMGGMIMHVHLAHMRPGGVNLDNLTSRKLFFFSLNFIRTIWATCGPCENETFVWV